MSRASNAHAESGFRGDGEARAHLRPVGAGQWAWTLAVVFNRRPIRRPQERRVRERMWLAHASVREAGDWNSWQRMHGTPAVVYPVDGLVDSTVHGRTGLVVDRESPEALAQGVRALLGNPAAYETMRHEAWTRAKSLQWANVLPPTCDWLEAQACRSAPA